jgi:Fur family transcriptional regulator, ferric uptake regulator
MINLNDFGIKTTKSRKLILTIIENSNEPITAEDIYKQILNEGINLSTVYRTLTSLHELHIINKEIDKDGRALYMMIKENHKHVLICTKCGLKIYLKECPYTIVNQEIEKTTGFKIEDHNIELYGLCDKCKNKGVLEI